jgi:hypothetical protein
MSARQSCPTCGEATDGRDLERVRIGLILSEMIIKNVNHGSSFSLQDAVCLRRVFKEIFGFEHTMPLPAPPKD